MALSKYCGCCSVLFACCVFRIVHGLRIVRVFSVVWVLVVVFFFFFLCCVSCVVCIVLCVGLLLFGCELFVLCVFVLFFVG